MSSCSSHIHGASSSEPPLRVQHLSSFTQTRAGFGPSLAESKSRTTFPRVTSHLLLVSHCVLGTTFSSQFHSACFMAGSKGWKLKGGGGGGGYCLAILPHCDLKGLAKKEPPPPTHEGEPGLLKVVYVLLLAWVLKP